MKRTYTILAITFAMLSLSSCSKFLEDYSQDLAKVQSWEDLEELLLGDGYLPVSRIYVANSTFITSDVNMAFEPLNFMTDEIEENYYDASSDLLGLRSKMYPFYTWMADTGVDEDGLYAGGDEDYWNRLYKHINTCNVVLSTIDEQPEQNAEDREGKSKVRGEAHFLRAFYYLLLVNMYAKPYDPKTASQTPGVPVKLTEYVQDIEFERTPVADVYSQIIADLEVAMTELDGTTRKSIYHADKTSVEMLLARTYLYMQDWQNAAKYAQMVLDTNSSLYDLHTAVAGSNCISASSPETIFSMGGYVTAIAFYDSYYNEASYFLSDTIMSYFEDENDLRSSLYVGATEGQQMTPVMTKFSGQYSSFGSYQDVSDCCLLRTPEAYLILAEANLHMGKEDEARKTLNTFLKTRQVSPVAVTESGSELMALIRAERVREFLLEGQRWFDLRRYSVMSDYPYTVSIIHGHGYNLTLNTITYKYKPECIYFYELTPGDAALTLPIPRAVREQQVSIGNNERPERKPVRTEK